MITVSVTLVLACVVIALNIPARFEAPSKQADKPSAGRISPSATRVVSAASVEPASLISKPTPAHESDPVLLRPLPVSSRSGTHEWTADDATRTEIIEKIAHNPDEFIRLVEENTRIKRRQLVYRNETVPMLLDRARASGQPLKSVKLPGLDGREIEIEVVEINEQPGGRAGSVAGRVKGRPNSMAVVGFFNGCESFNVLSPDEGLYLTADAREPGEVLVKEIDPDQYSPPAKCVPLITSADKPKTQDIPE